MYFGNVSDRAGPDHFCTLPRALVRVTLVAHLRSHSILFSSLQQFTAFPNRMRQRLLDVYMLAALHRVNCSRCMHVIRNCNDDRIDSVAARVEHLPVIFVLRNAWIAQEHLLGALFVHIAQRHDVFRFGASRNVALGFPAGSDRGNIELLVRRFVAQRFQRRRTAKTSYRDTSRQQSTEEKVSSTEPIVFHLE